MKDYSEELVYIFTGVESLLAASERRAEGGFHSVDPCCDTGFCISSLSSGFPVGMSPEIAGAEDTIGSVVMGNGGSGSAGPPQSSCSSSPTSGVPFSSQVGVFGVGMVGP